MLACDYKGLSNYRDMKPLFPIYYIIKPHLLKQFSSGAPGGILAVQLNLYNEVEQLQCYQDICNMKAKTPFCLYLDLSGVPDIPALHNMASFFFLPHYYQPGDEPEILLCCKEEHVEMCAETLRSNAGAQGFNNIKCKKTYQKNVYTSSLKEKLLNDYLAKLNNETIMQHDFLIEVEDVSIANEIDTTLEQEEKRFANENKMLHYVKHEYKNLTESVQKLERSFVAATTEIANQQSHIAILRSQTQAAHLQNYYNNEYEILPTWYKRFGHLVKALTGKRRFRSLFDNNVKKYRQ